MEKYNEEFRNKFFESFLDQKDEIINRRDDDFLNPRNEFCNRIDNQRDDVFNPRNRFFNRIDYFDDRRDDAFNPKNRLFNLIDYFDNQKDDAFAPKNGFLNPRDDYFSPRKDIFSKEYFSDSDYINNSFKKVFDVDWNNSKETDINLDINKNKENIKIIKNIEIKINNSIIKETPCISQENTSKFKSKKESKNLGRKRNKNVKTSNEQEKSSHGIYAEDNLSVKIQTHYINFIISALNCIFPHFNFNKKLCKLDKKFKINIKKDNVGSLNDKTIGEIISNKISIKYTSIEDKINANKNICEEIKNNPILNKILSENYLVFFKKFYYKSDSYINLKDYGLNKNINFTKEVENFKHLLKKNKKRGNEYIMLIKEFTYRNYLPGLMFIC